MVLTRDDEAAPPLIQIEQPRRDALPVPGTSQQAVERPCLFMAGAEVNRVGMRMPEFTSGDPELWFNIIDWSFQAAGITTDATKFGYVLTAIGPRHAMKVRDIIMNPPAERAYETVRCELIKRLSLSQEHKTRRLLKYEEIGDRKPTQFLRHLRGLAGNVVGDEVLRTIWLSRLPVYLQPHLVTRVGDTLETLANMADAIVEATRAPAVHVAEAARPTAFAGADGNGIAVLEARINVQMTQMRMAMQQEFAEQMTGLRKCIEALEEREPRRSDGGGRRRRERSRSRSRVRGHASNHLCYYH
ncbi:uncharacterized protein LOC114944905 [Nylanderia fulva]|uniref:uncharacterized protein LOC114934380 n=1 Tax=Nylanderia fulva TaxID=613905 RepID=UPI0010FB334C|nr:uncharacterized protein LOC114934380 [Nylanderia fulva]XP_029164151.1 uncharacterized protein LOC114935465 [Nylanderia fulva]XP_029173403.1 uncharacterized protein LOC114942253 [Nylanderia fulva]XP_029176795.1 uncharacterized protein LOC114944905 [Nylanderia fulva]